MESVSQNDLEGERLQLRAFKLSDAKIVQKLAGNKVIADTTEAIPHPYEDGMAEQWIATHKPELEKKNHISYAITLKDSGELIGAIGLALYMKHLRAEVGYWVGHPYWNKGYATEALLVLLKFAKNELKLNKVMARHLTRNIASGKVMKKNEFIHKCRLERHVCKNDTYEDIELWEKLL